MPENAKDTYKKISALIDNWLELHKNETFDLDTICRQLEIHERDNRNLVTIKLAYEVKKEHLEKSNKVYRYIDSTIVYIDWLNASDVDAFDLVFPNSHIDSSHFSFDKNVVISPGDVIIIAGVSNMGKTAFCLNFLWENMDKYPCTLMGNEYTPGKFKRRILNMGWNTPVKEDGKSKFELIERREGWKDIIRPDNINIIDWISMDDAFYKMGKLIEGIQSKLRKGIVIISLQKDSKKELGEGGRFSEQLASLYLVVDFERLTVRKAKEWHNINPNGQVYGFGLAHAGTAFKNIRLMKKCPKCFAKCLVNNYKCETCDSKGYVEYEHDYVPEL